MMPRLESTISQFPRFSPLPTDLGVTFLERHLTYTGQLEEYISRYKRRPEDIKHWPYGPYWPKHFDGFLLNTPRHRWAEILPDEDDRLLKGQFGREVNASSKTFDSQVTPFKGKWRGIQVTFDSERSPRDFSALNVPEGCCPSLAFESRFECGNLRQARRIGQFEYELVLKSDLYTARHTQWYYFRVTNVVPGVAYKFRIVNLLKRDSLYNHGMRPLVYSEKDAADNKKGWHRTGHHISYSRNITNHNCPLLQRGVSYFMLEWQMEFPNADDTYYLAHCYPYSFTDLKEDLEVMMNSEERAKVTRREVMCETRAGNSCFLLTVTNFNVQEPKKAVVITARVHPGESQASWMMKGLLEFITGPDSLAQELRNNFVFKIVPMINPDGVIVGNYRCSLAARDLNRNYRHPRRDNFPTVWYLKNMVEDVARKYEIALYCDLHGHSRKPNIFMYGNNTSSEGEPSALGMARAFISERLFPWLMSKRSPDKFAFRSCKFSIRRCKESTGRVVMWRQMGIFNSFTLEATFSGTVLDEETCRHFNILDFMSMGKTLAQTVLDYSKVQENPAQQTQTVLDLTRVITEQILVSKGLIDPGTTLPDFGITKDTVETDAGKVQESAERWTGALLQLLNAPHENRKEQQQQLQQQSSSAGKSADSQTASKSGGGGGSGAFATVTTATGGGGGGGVVGTDGGDLMRPVYTKDDVVAMLGKMTGKGTKNMEDCLGILAQLEAHENLDESDSSDSDSESEPEMKPPEPKPRKKKRKSKKNRDADKKGDKKHGDHDSRHKASSALPSLSATHRPGGSHSANSDNIHMGGKSGKQAMSEKGGSSGSALGQSGMKQMSGYISKYEGRHNGGVPCFTEERSMERAAKRMAELRKKHENDPHQRGDVAFYCVDDNGVHTMSQEELNQRLIDLAAVTNSSPATPLMGFNVKTGYTHANNLQDLTPAPHQPMNNVGSYLMTSSHSSPTHKQFALQDLADQSSSEDSESDYCSSITENTTNTNNNNGSGKLTSRNNNNSNNNNDNSKNNLRISPIKNAFTSNSKPTPTSSANGGGLVMKKSNGFAFPITSKKNPYQHLDPLEDSPLSSTRIKPSTSSHPHHSLNIQSQSLDTKLNGHTNNNNNTHRFYTSSTDNGLVPTSNTLFTVPPHYIKSNLLHNNNSQSTHFNNKTNPALPSSSPSTSNSPMTTGSTTVTSSFPTSTTTPRRTDTKPNQFYNNNNNHNNYNIPIHKTKPHKTDLDNKSNLLSGGHNEFKNDLKRSKTFYHHHPTADSSIPLLKGGGSSGADNNIPPPPSQQPLYQNVILGRSDLKLDVLNGAKRPPAINGHYNPNSHHKNSNGKKVPIQNVEKLVQQLSENLMGMSAPIPTSTKRMLHYNRNSPLYPPPRPGRQAMSNAASPFMTSGMGPTNRMAVLPDCLASPRVDDKTRIPPGRAHSGVIRSHRPSPGGHNHHQQEYSWE